MADTNPRDLIQRMAEEFEGWIVHAEAEDIERAHNLVDEARAYLNQPKPKEPTDEELHHLWLDLYAFHDGPTSGDVAEIARAALARWGK
jgi:hypothetical protein